MLSVSTEQSVCVICVYVCLCVWLCLSVCLSVSVCMCVYVSIRFVWEALTLTGHWWVHTVTSLVCFHRKALRCGVTLCRGSRYQSTQNHSTLTTWVCSCDATWACSVHLILKCVCSLILKCVCETAVDVCVAVCADIVHGRTLWEVQCSTEWGLWRWHGQERGTAEQGLPLTHTHTYTWIMSVIWGTLCCAVPRHAAPRRWKHIWSDAVTVLKL